MKRGVASGCRLAVFRCQAPGSEGWQAFGFSRPAAAPMPVAPPLGGAGHPGIRGWVLCPCCGQTLGIRVFVAAVCERLDELHTPVMPVTPFWPWTEPTRSRSRSRSAPPGVGGMTPPRDWVDGIGLPRSPLATANLQ